MSVRVEKDKKGPTWIISHKSQEGFTKQIIVTISEIKVLHSLLGDVLRRGI